MKSELVFMLLCYSDQDLAMILRKYGYTNYSKDFFHALRKWLYVEIYKCNRYFSPGKFIENRIKKFTSIV